MGDSVEISIVICDITFYIYTMLYVFMEELNKKQSVIFII